MSCELKTNENKILFTFVASSFGTSLDVKLPTLFTCSVLKEVDATLPQWAKSILELKEQAEKRARSAARLKLSESEMGHRELKLSEKKRRREPLRPRVRSSSSKSQIKLRA